VRDIAIRVEDLSKEYTIGVGPSYETLRDRIANGMGRLFRNNGHHSPEPVTFWAIRDVSFEVKRGEVLGVIGRNGAGKSTLLKILCRITQPTRGYAEICGRVGSLLEVGTGFHQELTGRENIYLSGAIIGMRKNEIDCKFDEIVAFAEVEKFIDTPVKHYSSGMYLRLGFAVAAHFEPEILLVDEVLAVGDLAFQKKCLGKMGDVAKEGRTVLFVSHNMASIEALCDTAMVLQDGKILVHGEAKDAVDSYLRSVGGDDSDTTSQLIDLSNAAGRPGKYRPMLQSLELFTDQDRPLKGMLKIGAPLKARIKFKLERPAAGFDAALAIDNLLGQRIFTANSICEPNRQNGEWVGTQSFVCDIPSLPLVPAKYKLSVSLLIPQGVEVDRVEDAAFLTVVESDYYGTGKRPRSGIVVLKHRWYLN